MIGIPIYCVAFANQRVHSVKSFGCTAPNDFAILGPDLMEWIASTSVFVLCIYFVLLMKQNRLWFQIYWTVLGVPVTPTFVESFIYSFGGIIPAVVVGGSKYLNKK
jgi:hypothetical protein